MKVLNRILCIAAVALLPVGRCALAGSPLVPGEEEARYEVHGVLRSVDSAHSRATIAHEAIPGYMPAMVMDFDLRNASEGKSLRAGDSVVFRLHVRRNSAWVDRVKKTGSSEPPLFEPAVSNSQRERKPGDLLPDVELTGDAGERIHLSNFLGNAVAITFIYTRCPLPTYCPRMSGNFQLAKVLLERLGYSARCRFLSVTMDPEHDTPAVLAEYGRPYQTAGDHWTFATGEVEAVRTLGNAVGLEFKREGGTVSHNLRTVVLGANGRIRRIFIGNDWTPQELAAEMRGAVRNGP